jgi:hypothetical protein
MEMEALEQRSSAGPLATLRKIIPYEAAAASDHLGWVGLQAARYYAAPASELYPPPRWPIPGLSIFRVRRWSWIWCTKA